MRYRKIPDEAVRRLPVYLRGALYFSEQNIERVSSQTLADLTGVNAWQIRKDFSYFGNFGTPGVGYNPSTIIKRINKILKLDVIHRVVLVGVGNLGSAILAFPGFGSYRFEISAAFDNDKRKIGKKRNGIVIRDVRFLKTIQGHGIDLGIIAVPGEDAADVAEELVDVGIKGILNFSPRYISVPEKVKVITIDIAMDLARLPYYIRSG